MHICCTDEYSKQMGMIQTILGLWLWHRGITDYILDTGSMCESVAFRLVHKYVSYSS